MNSKRTVEFHLSHQTLADLVETHLRNVKLVLNNEDVSAITFGNLNDPLVPTKVEIREEGNAQVAKELQKETS